MKANIVEINNSEPRKNLVKHLENLLKCARAGELRSICSACEWAGARITTGWSLDGRTRLSLMAGSLAVLQFELLTEIAADDKESVLSRRFNGED